MPQIRERPSKSLKNLPENWGMSMHGVQKHASVSGKSGLEKAAQKYDHSRGFKFIAYAVWWIRQPMLVAIESKK